MAQFERIILWLSDKLRWGAYVGLIVMMVLTCADVTGRYVFNSPILGVFDATGLIAVVVIASALAKTQILRGHISIDLFVRRLGRRPRAILHSVIWLISLGLFSIISWRSFVYATTLQHFGTGTMSVGIPLYPFAYLIAVASGMMCMVLLVDFINSLAEARRK